MERNSYIVKGSFLNFLGASILTTVALQLSMTINAIIVGHFISPMALSGISAIAPLTCVVGAFSVLFGIGAGIRISRLIGNRDTKGVHQAYTSAFLSLLIVGCCITLFISCFHTKIVTVLCNNQQIIPLLIQYMKVYTFIPLFTLISGFLCYCVEVDGKPKLVSKIIIVSGISNIVFNLLFVGLFGMGMKGSASATLLSLTFQITLLWIYGLRRSEVFQIQYKEVMKRCHFLKEIGNNMRVGSTLTITNIALALLVFVLNSIVVSKLGTVGMNIWSICLQILMLSLMILNGISNAAVTIGSVLMGQKDIRGITELHTIVLRLLGLSVAGLTILMLIAPDLFLQLFGANEDMMAAGATRIIRIFSLCLLPFAMIIIRQSFLVVLQHYLFGALVSLSMICSILLGVWVFSLLSPENLWWGFSVSLIFLNLIIIFVMWAINLKLKTSSAFTLIPNDERSKSWSISLPYDQTSLTRVLDESQQFLCDNNIETDRKDKCRLILEELVTNILKFATKGKDNQYFDVYIKFIDNEVIVVIKDDGIPFNPTLSDNYNNDGAEFNDVSLGLRIVNNLALEMAYKYMYGQNVVTISLK